MEEYQWKGVCAHTRLPISLIWGDRGIVQWSTVSHTHKQYMDRNNCVVCAVTHTHALGAASLMVAVSQNGLHQPLTLWALCQNMWPLQQMCSSLVTHTLWCQRYTHSHTDISIMHCGPRCRITAVTRRKMCRTTIMPARLLLCGC